MTIQTAFDRGDQVFFMENNKIESGFIFSIIMHETENGNFVKYYIIRENGQKKEVTENTYLQSQLFASKEILRQSL